MQPANGQTEGSDSPAMVVQASEQKEHSATPLKKFEVLYTQERSEKDKEVSLPSAFVWHILIFMARKQIA